MKTIGQSCAIAALVLGLGFSAVGASQVSAQPDSVTAPSVSIEQVRFTGGNASSAEAADVEQALIGFVSAMADGDAKRVWSYASEEDQAGFETEDALFTAFAEDFPALTEATEIHVQSFRNEGDTPFVKLVIRDANSNGYTADIGLWLDDAGDWKVVSCDIVPTTDQIAAL